MSKSQATVPPRHVGANQRSTAQGNLPKLLTDLALMAMGLGAVFALGLHLQ